MAVKAVLAMALVCVLACGANAQIAKVDDDGNVRVKAPFTKVTVRPEADIGPNVVVDAPFAKVVDDKVLAGVPFIGGAFVTADETHVRAPFTKVDVNEDGRVRVRAAGVKVDLDETGAGTVKVPFIGTFPVKSDAERAEQAAGAAAARAERIAKFAAVHAERVALLAARKQARLDKVAGLAAPVDLTPATDSITDEDFLLNGDQEGNRKLFSS